MFAADLKTGTYLDCFVDKYKILEVTVDAQRYWHFKCKWFCVCSRLKASVQL